MSEESAVLARLTDLSWSVLEVGPGGHPTPWPGPYTSVDRTQPGQSGTAGSESGVTCTAAYCAEMHALPFAAEQFDAVIARHVLEHHPDTLAVLREWARVLKPGGALAVVCPDQRTYRGNTIHLDPTHEAAFTPEQLAALAGHAGFVDVEAGPCLPEWSFVLYAKREAL